MPDAARPGVRARGPGRPAEAETPLYRAVELDLRAQIAAGKLAEGGLLPSEQALCQQYQVSRITVRRALAELAAAGLVVSKNGRGSYVAADAGILRPKLSGSLGAFLDAAARLRTRTLTRQSLPPPAEVRACMGLEDGEPAALLQTVSDLEGAPVTYSDVWLPEPLGSVFLAGDERVEYEALAKAVERLHGVQIVVGKQTVWAKAADEDEAAHLGVAVGTAILAMMRTYFSEDGQAVELVYVRYHPDRFRFEITLDRA